MVNVLCQPGALVYSFSEQSMLSAQSEHHTRKRSAGFSLSQNKACCLLSLSTICQRSAGCDPTTQVSGERRWESSERNRGACLNIRQSFNLFGHSTDNISTSSVVQADYIRRLRRRLTAAKTRAPAHPLKASRRFKSQNYDSPQASRVSVSDLPNRCPRSSASWGDVLSPYPQSHRYCCECTPPPSSPRLRPAMDGRGVPPERAGLSSVLVLLEGGSWRVRVLCVAMGVFGRISNLNCDLRLKAGASPAPCHALSDACLPGCQAGRKSGCQQGTRRVTKCQ